MPIVYEELRRLAHHYMRGEREGHTLQTTALVTRCTCAWPESMPCDGGTAPTFRHDSALMRRVLWIMRVSAREKSAAPGCR